MKAFSHECHDLGAAPAYDDASRETICLKIEPTRAEHIMLQINAKSVLTAATFSLLLTFVPLAAHVRRVLDERTSHIARRSRFIDELDDFMSEDSAEQTLSVIVSWGRYAELFAYEDESERFTLENPA